MSFSKLVITTLDFYNKEYDYNEATATIVGKSIISEKFPSTMDSFWFVVGYDAVINPFDFVSVDNVNNSTSIGIIKDIQSVVIEETSLHSDAMNYVSNDYRVKENVSNNTLEKIEARGSLSSSAKQASVVVTVAKVAVVANTGEENLKDKKLHENFSRSLNMPIQIGKVVRYATPDQISFALGIPKMERPIPAGIIEMSNGTQIPVSLDVTYIAGPDTAHVNVSGISGNQKTGFLLFLLQSSYQTLLKKLKEKVAIIIFNTKEDDLLRIDKKSVRISDRQTKMFDILNLKLKPFKNVTYFLPRGADGLPDSFITSSIKDSNFKTYSYELQDVYDRLELLFPDLNDTRYNLRSIVDYIHETWPSLMIDDDTKNIDKNKNRKKIEIKTWTDLLRFYDYPTSIVPNKLSLLYFQSYLQKLKNSSIFVDKKVRSTYLGKEIMNIKSGDVFVIDLAMVSSIPEQSFIVGDVMKTVDHVVSSSDFSFSKKRKKDIGKNRKPQYLFVFIDEINRFTPPSAYGLSPGLLNSVSEQILRTIMSGRSRRTILFSAQQFKSATDLRLHDNTGLHVTAKLGLSELSRLPYSDLIDDNTKNSITRLNKGEMVMIHPAFKHAIKISFPRASIKKP
jgi:uncharacterized protein